MSDIFPADKRSAIMASIRGTGNVSTELRLIKIFAVFGITGWRRKAKVMGKPDFVFSKLKLVVFVDGCFWHDCPLHATRPKNNAEFWQEKIASNKTRDHLVTRMLRTQGWRVLRIWEHELAKKNTDRLAIRLRRVGLIPGISDQIIRGAYQSD